MNELECYFVAEDPRYPTLVIRDNGETFGFSYNRETGELTRCCICAAYSDNECVCGYVSESQ